MDIRDQEELREIATVLIKLDFKIKGCLDILAEGHQDALNISTLRINLQQSYDIQNRMRNRLGALYSRKEGCKMYNFGTTLLKGIKSFFIALAVVILGAVVQALGGFNPDPGNQMAVWIWNLAGAGLIGSITAFINWLKNKDK